MTRKSSLRLDTGALIRDAGARSLVIEWSPDCPEVLVLRAKGRRQRYSINLLTLYTKAAGSADIPKGRRAHFKERSA